MPGPSRQERGAASYDGTAPAVEDAFQLLQLAIDAAHQVAQEGTPDEVAGALHVLRAILSADSDPAENVVGLQ